MVDLIKEDKGIMTINRDAVEFFRGGITQEGKDLVLDPELSKQLAMIKKAQKYLAEVEGEVKAALIVTMAEYNSDSLKGAYTTISISGGRSDRKYELQEGFKHQWGTQKTSYEPNVEKIDAYFSEHGTVPEGVTLREVKPSVSIRPKKDK